MNDTNNISKSEYLKSEIQEELKKRNTPLDDEIRKRCVLKSKEDKLLLISVTRKVKKDFNERSKTMKKMLKVDDKKEKIIRKNAEIAFKLQLKESEKEEKLMRKKAKIAFNLQLKKDEKMNKKGSESKVKKIAIDESVVENYLKRIVVENNRNDKNLFDSLGENGNVRNKQNELKNMEKVFDKQIVNYLNTICTDSGECLAFGRENANIRRLFSDFIDFNYLSKVLNVGKESGNGFVLNLYYESMNYKANALLKSSKNKNSDNLYYEYLVGTLFINKMNNIFPCFTETYHLFEHRTEKSKERLQKNELSVSKYSKWIKLNDCDTTVIKENFKCVDESCKNGVNFAILVQYINNPISIASFMKEHGTDDLFEDQMICILYQIYACLSYLKDHFTHYDLHTDNVLLYKLPDGKYVNMNYIDESSGNTVSIKTNYIAKIIDYGRCYFGNLGNNGLPSSKTIGDMVFNSKICSKLGATNVGYKLLKEATKRNFYISSLFRNKSHDLRLAFIVSKRSKKMGNIFRERIIFDEPFGTSERESDRSGNLRNVTDMFHFLEKMCIDGIESVEPQDTPIGTIDINMTKKICEKKMVFVSDKSIK